MTAIAAAVLTGGESRRMGRDKATLPVAGVPLAVRVATVARAAGLDPVVAVGGAIERLDRHGLPGIPDRWPGEGPLGGVLTALRWSPTPRLLVMACDLPMLDVATVRAVAVEDHDAHAVMAFTDRLEPLFAVWDVTHAAPELQAAFDSGERSIRHAIRGLRIRRIELAGAGPLTDADTPDQLPREPA
jgi:molybdopterin-guanine dinucleotide biosynthesis protein A